MVFFLISEVPLYRFSYRPEILIHVFETHPLRSPAQMFSLVGTPQIPVGRIHDFVLGKTI